VGHHDLQHHFSEERDEGMHTFEISRREVIVGGAATVALAAMGVARPALAPGTLTVQQVLDRMKLNVGGPWREGRTVDRIIAGSADMEVTGIGTMMMATFDALKDAVKAGTNLVITHEPTYWSHPDTLTDLMDDPLYKTKLDYIRAHNLVSFHFHDHWHALRPVDGINYGMQQQMGWTRYMDPNNQRVFNLPPTTLLGLAKDFQTKLGARTLRVVGDPNMPVKKVYESWGYCSSFPGVNFLTSDVDVLVIGEAQDWDLVAYAQDLVASGQKKALILLGHVRSEMFGMKYCAEWLKGFFPEVPVKFIPTIEPYWNLEQPAFEINPKL
jgi:putative NIF3 family GTP cyclohydrolase 1 type 2